MKLAWDVPRWSHNYFVDHVLAPRVPPVRRFFRKMLIIERPEIRILANLVIDTYYSLNPLEAHLYRYQLLNVN